MKRRRNNLSEILGVPPHFCKSMGNVYICNAGQLKLHKNLILAVQVDQMTSHIEEDHTNILILRNICFTKKKGVKFEVICKTFTAKTLFSCYFWLTVIANLVVSPGNSI